MSKAPPTSPTFQWLPFVIQEFLVFLTQMIIFGLVAWLFSHYFMHKDLMEVYVNSKVNVHTGNEFSLTLLAITVVLGVLAFISAVATNPAVSRLSREVLYEAPRTIYFFGSTVASTGLTLALYLKLYPASELDANAPAVLSLSSGMIALVAFAYGCLFKGLLERKRLQSQNDKTAAGAVSAPD